MGALSGKSRRPALFTLGDLLKVPRRPEFDLDYKFRNMSDMSEQGLDEIPEHKLREELHRRGMLRARARCDYCAGNPDDPPCKFPERHAAPTLPPAPPDTPDDPLGRLDRWLRANPHDLMLLALGLGLPLPRCEGHAHECSGIVVQRTRCMTAYTWDGTGEDPNRDPLLCPTCSVAYTEAWEAQWDEYHRSQR